MTLVVLKFGGTSLANTKLMNNAVAKVVDEVNLGHKVIVVVSAMAGVTDHLVNLVNEITNCDSPDSIAEYASVVTTGEQVSAGLFSLLLQSQGLKARSWQGWQAGIITDDNINDAAITQLNCHKIASSFAHGYQVAVVTGFQGVTKQDRISTLGRGGSDTSAIILAGALSADKCDIYTDVEGVFSADPRIVAKARKINHINYEEMIAFAHAGAKVLQAKSVEWAQYYQVKIRVLSSFTTNMGTLVSYEAKANDVAGIAISKDKISIIGTNIAENKLLLDNITNSLAKAKIEILAIDISSMIISLTVNDEYKFNAIKLLHTICKLDEDL